MLLHQIPIRYTSRLTHWYVKSLERDRPRKVVNFLDKLAKEKLEPFIDKSYAPSCTCVNAYDQRMYMKREVIADKGIWTAKSGISSTCMTLKVCGTRNPNSR